MKNISVELVNKLADLVYEAETALDKIKVNDPERAKALGRVEALRHAWNVQIEMLEAAAGGKA